MKIALVAEMFSESTVAFAKALSEKGVIVDLYYFVYKKSHCEDPGFEFKTPRRKYAHLYEVEYAHSKGCQFAFNNDKCNIYIYQATPPATQHKGIIGYLAKTISKISMIPMIRRIGNGDYDIVDIISLSNMSIEIAKLLKHPNIVFSFHEIFVNHLEDKRILKESVLFAIKNNYKIRLFSDSVKEDLVSLYPEKESNIHAVPFGLFTSYKEFGHGVPSLSLPSEPYILFLGFITPYKGIDILYNAAKDVIKMSNTKLVIAGKGNVPILEDIKHDPDVTLINRFLTNVEIVECIKRSKFLVCPYLSASQSGLPQTAFVFNKPIIATGVGAFPQVIGENEFGILVPPKDIKALRSAISCLIKDKGLYGKIVDNISNINTLKPMLAWSNIVSSYIEEFRKN